MKSIDLASLLAGFADVSDTQNVALSNLCDDSRAVKAGDLFVAVRGYGEQHALHFARQAVERGAVAVIWETHSDANLTDIPSGVPVIEVQQLGQRFGEIAARFYQQPSASMTVAGVTGTDGKSSVTWMLATAWQQAGRSAGLIGTLGNGRVDALAETSHTTPLPLPLQRCLATLNADGAQCVAMEVSSHALEQNRVGGVAFDIAILTNLKRDHLDYHGSVEAYKAAKKKLFSRAGVKTLVLNIDDPFGAELVNAMANKFELISYSLINQDASLYATDISYALSGIEFTLCYQQCDYRVSTRLIGAFNVENALAVCAALLASGIDIAGAVELLATLTPPPGRMEQFSSAGKAIALVDYAHTPNALEQALNAARQHTENQLWVVFGCGGDRDAGKRAPMAAAAEAVADRIVVTSDNPRGESQQQIFNDIRAGFGRPANVQFIESRAEAIAHALGSAAANDLVVIAGKGHEDYQLIGGQQLAFSDREQVARWMAA